MNKKGFTLVELSIVLVILGLIVGGVVAGKELVIQAKLRSVVSDVNKINAAIRTFKVRYNALPGDFADGYEYFGDSCGDNVVANYNNRTGCNGNGNKLIEARMETGTDSSLETILAWRHLSEAGYIARSFQIPLSGSEATAITSDMRLESSLTNTYFSINSIGYTNGWSILGDGFFINRPPARKGLFINLGQSSSTNLQQQGNLINAGAITAIMAQSIDDKIDDGVALTGSVLTMRGVGLPGGLCGPTLTGGGIVSEYILTDEEETCRMSFEVK